MKIDEFVGNIRNCLWWKVSCQMAPESMMLLRFIPQLSAINEIVLEQLNADRHSGPAIEA